MSIELRTVRSTADKAEVYRLRHQVFVEEERRFHLTFDHIFDRFDSFAETSNFLAFDNGRAVAGIRLVLDGPAGLPAEMAFDFQPLRRTLSGGCATVGWFCIRKAYRRHPGLVVSLIQMCFRQMRRHNVRHVLAVVHPPALALMQRLVGARALAPAFEDHGLAVPIVPVHVDLENLPPGSRERFVDPEERLFDDSDVRRLLRRNEVIFRHGDIGGEVFQVMRGVVRIQPEGPLSEDTSQGPPLGHLLMGPGQCFGELSALDGRPRSATLIASSEDVDLMVWNRSDILDQLSAAPERALQLCRLLASRLRKTIDGRAANAATALAARLLVGAGQANHPVDTRWLAGQCGVDRGALQSLVLPWAQERLIAADDANTHIWVIDRNRLAQQVQI